MSRPGTRLSRFYEKIEQNGDHYDQIAKTGIDKWREIASDIGDDAAALEKAIEHIGRVLAHRARLTDKLNVFKTLIGDGIGKDDGGLSDHQALLILAGWSTEHRALHDPVGVEENQG